MPPGIQALVKQLFAKIQLFIFEFPFDRRIKMKNISKPTELSENFKNLAKSCLHFIKLESQILTY